MLVDFDPTIFHFGPLQVRWYGLMYVIGFLVGVRILAHLFKVKWVNLDPEKADVIMTYLLVGMFIFARLFYVVIYNWEATHSFYDAIAVWRGGLSFHGAAIGFIIATLIFCRRNKIGFFPVMDSIVLSAPQGLFWGRIGNFINGELYGRVTDSPLGMVFASDPERLTRHPSQLYQAMTEGLVLMAIVWLVKRSSTYYGKVSASFLVGYGLLRYFVEFFREADPQLGYYFGGTTTMGQILCLLMVAAGIVIYVVMKQKNQVIYPLCAEALAVKKKRSPKKKKNKKRK